MSYKDVLKRIEKRQLSPVYLFYGTESFFIQNLEQQLKKAVLPDKDLDNLSIYDLEETPIQEVARDAETYPLFGEKKLIIAKNAVFLKAKPGKLSIVHDLGALQLYVEKPVDYAVLVLIAPYEKIDERKKIVKSLKKYGTVAICNQVKEQELDMWIKAIANEYKIAIETDAIEIMEAQLAANLYLLHNEMKKLSLYVGEGGVVTKQIVEDLVSHTINSSSLQLVDAVISRNLHQAITIYKDLQKTKEEPIAIVALLAFQFRTILRVKLLKQKGYSQFQMQKELGVHPYVIKIALNREKSFTVQRLENIMDKLAEADAAMKQGIMEKELAFELVLYELIRGNK